MFSSGAASRWSLSMPGPEDMEEDDLPVCIWQPEGMQDDAVRQVQVSCHDKTGLGCDVARLFLDYGLHILKAEISTDGEWALLIFLVRACDPAVPAAWDRLERSLYGVIPSEHKEITRRLLRLTNPKPLHAAHVLEIAAHEGEGPLPLRELMQKLWECECTVFSAHMAPRIGGIGVHRLWLLDDLGKLPDAARSATICDAAASVLGPGDHGLALRPAHLMDGTGDGSRASSTRSDATTTSVPAQRGRHASSAHIAESAPAGRSFVDVGSPSGSPRRTADRCADPERHVSVSGRVDVAYPDADADDADADDADADADDPDADVAADARCESAHAGAEPARARVLPESASAGAELARASEIGAAARSGPASISDGMLERAGCKDCEWDAPLNRARSAKGGTGGGARAHDDRAFLQEWLEGAWTGDDTDADVQIELDNLSSARSTVISVACRDRKGLLYDQFRTLKDSVVRVLYASVEVLPGGNFEGNLVVEDAVHTTTGGIRADVDLQNELIRHLRGVILLPLRILVTPGPQDVGGSPTTTVTITAQADSGRRGRPRVTFDTCAAFQTMGLEVRDADVYMHPIRVGGSSFTVETHRFRVAPTLPRVRSGSSQAMDEEARAALRAAVRDALVGCPPPEASPPASSDGPSALAAASAAEHMKGLGFASSPSPTSCGAAAAADAKVLLATSWAYM